MKILIHQNVARAVTILAALAAATGPVEAAVRSCRVKPTSVITDNAGHLHLNGLVQPSGTAWSWQLVCSVSANVRNVTPEACRNWSSAALTAQSTGKVLYMLFDDAQNGGVTDCAQFPAWDAPYILYLGPEG